jgi:glycosyltransferase involved in cell wall biosynthesis
LEKSINQKKIVLVCDSFPPTSSSAANQIFDLSDAISKLGLKLTILTPSSEIKSNFKVEDHRDFKLIKIKTLKIKDINLLRRTIGEFLMPYMMIGTIRKHNLLNFNIDGVIWYSPSIFFGPLIRYIKKNNSCNSYLILRDIFPEWAADMGLIGRGPIYFILKLVANYQYSLADRIGIQSEGNSKYFTKDNHKIEVLQNWLTPRESSKCSIDISRTILSGRKIFVYAGNMGVAQDVDIFLKLAKDLKDERRIGFIFVGRGKNSKIIHKGIKNHNLDNLLIYDEIDNREMQKLYLQCYVGILSLNLKHRSHNIPGKFISYIHYGLPVLASLNKGNDLIKIIQSENLGKVSFNGSVQDLKTMSLELIRDEKKYDLMKKNCIDVSAKFFSSQSAAKQIIKGLKLF